MTARLATVAHISRRIAVMYLGQVVELADPLKLCDKPLNPYTHALFAAALPARGKGTTAVRCDEKPCYIDAVVQAAVS